MITFNHPWLLWTLLGLLPFAWLRLHSEGRRFVLFPPKQLDAGGQRGSMLIKLLVPFEVAILALLIVGAADPGRFDEIEHSTEDGIDIALVLDISASMQAADFPPNRLEALKQIGCEFIHRAGGNRLSIQAFAKTCFTQSPLTTDNQILLDMIDGLAYESIDHSESGGTAIGDALLGATDSLGAASIKGRDQVVILITDGESNLGVDPLLAARYLREEGLGLHIIGVGGDEEVEVYVHGKPFINTDDEILTTSLDDEQLITIADTAGGTYQRARSREVLDTILDDLSRRERTPLEITTIRHYRSFAHFFGLAAAILLALQLLLHDRLRRPLL